MLIQEKELKKLFNLSYGEKAPSREEWESLYNKQVKFIDPTQEKMELMHISKPKMD